jgi:uncharacterized protein (DUF1778 family)
MRGPSQSFTIGGRVNEAELARVDAAARLQGVQRARFIVAATLARSTEVLKRAASSPPEQGSGGEMSGGAA